jgi:hypothetical protein
MSKLFVLLYMDVAVSDFKIYATHEEALKEYLRASIQETRRNLAEDEEDQESVDDNLSTESKENMDSSDEEEDDVADPEYVCDDDLDDVTCILQMFEANGTEYKPYKEFDIEYFQDFLSGRDDLATYLDELDEALSNDCIPPVVLEAFAP